MDDLEINQIVLKKIERNCNCMLYKFHIFADEIKPMLEAAEASLKALNKNDITEVKAMKRPPIGVLLVIEAMCIVNNVKPHKVRSIICIIMQIYYKIIFLFYKEDIIMLFIL